MYETRETAENSVNVAHLLYVHGYDNVYPNGEVEVDGAYLLGKFHFTRIRRIANGWKMMNDVDAVTHVRGAGYSFVEVREIRKPKRFFMGLRFL